MTFGQITVSGCFTSCPLPYLGHKLGLPFQMQYKPQEIEGRCFCIWHDAFTETCKKAWFCAPESCTQCSWQNHRQNRHPSISSTDCPNLKCLQENDWLEGQAQLLITAFNIAGNSHLHVCVLMTTTFQTDRALYLRTSECYIVQP